MNELVFVKRQQPVTTSLLVAKTFDKLHKNVLRDIEKLNCSKEFTKLNFEPSEYIDSTGRKLPMYYVTQDGFTILVMGLNGKKAMQFKEAYIGQFNQMRNILQNHKDRSWIEARKQGKLIRRQETDIIQEFVEYATGQGSQNAQRYYMNITKMTNRALKFLVQVKEGAPIRDLIEVQEHFFVGLLDNRASEAIRYGMEVNMFYKDIYKYAKEEVNQLANSMKFRPRRLGA
jgi:Rha family phage regulatory protein